MDVTKARVKPTPTLRSLHAEAYRRALEVLDEYHINLRTDLSYGFGEVHLFTWNGTRLVVRIHQREIKDDHDLSIDLSEEQDPAREASATWRVEHGSFMAHGDGIAPGFAQLAMVLRSAP